MCLLEVCWCPSNPRGHDFSVFPVHTKLHGHHNQGTAGPVQNQSMYCIKASPSLDKPVENLLALCSTGSTTLHHLNVVQKLRRAKFDCRKCSKCLQRFKTVQNSQKQPNSLPENVFRKIVGNLARDSSKTAQKTKPPKFEDVNYWHLHWPHQPIWILPIDCSRCRSALQPVYYRSELIAALHLTSNITFSSSHWESQTKLCNMLCPPRLHGWPNRPATLSNGSHSTRHLPCP